MVAISPRRWSSSAARRTVEGLWDTIGDLVDTFTPTECANDFADCGYDAD